MIVLDKKNKSEQIKDSLREMLLASELAPGSRFYSENKLTSMFGVARMTINKALSVLETEGLLTRIQGKGTFVSDNVDKIRAEINSTQQLPIALVTSFRPQDIKLTSYTCIQYVNYIDDKAYSENQKVTVFNLNDYEVIPDSIYEELQSGKFLAIIIYHLHRDEHIDDIIRKVLVENSAPVILAGYLSDLVDSVDYDQRWIGWRGADFLLELGHSKLGFIGYKTTHSWMNDRIDGFFDACEKSMTKCEEPIVYNLSGGASYKPGTIESLEDIFDDIVASCTAVMCANDEIAGMFADIANKRGVKIPEDISLIGVDDNMTYRAYNFTTFRLAGEEIAQSCLDMINNRQVNHNHYLPEKKLLKPRLTVRQTTMKV